jgi:CO/xanthine dehydrogenase FAD-binding subunit
MNAFLLGPFTTALEPDEMIVALRLPPTRPRSYAAFREFALRSGDFALASAGVVVELDEGGVVRRARVVVGAVEPIPRALEVLAGERLGDNAIAKAAHAVATSCDAADDRNVDAATRRDLVRVLVRDALTDVQAQVAA